MTTAVELIHQVIESHRFDKDGDLLIADLCRLYLAQSQEVREEFVHVYRNWLKSGDLIKADWAIALIRRLDLQDELSTLERMLQEVKGNNSVLPRYFEQFLVPAIAELKRGANL